MKLLVPVLLSLSFVACATKPPQSVLERADKIAVFSVFENKVTIIQSNTSTKETAVPVADWKIAQVVTDDVLIELKKLNKEAFALKVDEARIAASIEEAVKLRNIYLGNSYQLLEQYVVGEAEAQGARYLFAVHPMSSDKYPQHRAGYGFYCQSTKGMKGDLEAYSLIRLIVLDMKSKERIASIVVTPEQAAFKTGKTCAEAGRMNANQLVQAYKEQLLTLVKKSTTVALEATNTPPPQEKK